MCGPVRVKKNVKMSSCMRGINTYLIITVYVPSDKECMVRDYHMYNKNI